LCHLVATVRYTERCLAEIGIEPSVGSIRDSYDNALAERINGLYKTEVIHPNGPWRTVDEIEFATLEWVDWFNERRLLEPIVNIPPAEFEPMKQVAPGSYWEPGAQVVAGEGFEPPTSGL